MNTYKSLLKHSATRILAVVILLNFLQSAVSAQTITEALQKQIWPNALTWPVTAWENLLPSYGQDTLYQAAFGIKECLLLDDLGFPKEVLSLQLVGSEWQPIGKVMAHFDQVGRLTCLQSWKIVEGKWENESLSTRTLDTIGEDADFQIRHWEDGKWDVVYQFINAGNATAISGNLEP